MARWGSPAARLRSGATNITHSTNSTTWSTAASTQLTAYHLLANQLLAIDNTLPRLLSSAVMSHLHLGLPLLLLRTLLTLSSAPPISHPLAYTAVDLHSLKNNHCLPAAAATAASKAGILRRCHYIHRSSGPSRNQHLPHGSLIPSLWTNSRPPVTHICCTANLNNLRYPFPAPPSISLALLNCRALSIKSPIISELLQRPTDI